MDDIDLTNLLREWPYEPGNINVRVVEASRGRRVIQLRIDLGILQMEMEGRPDGQRPHGHESLLDYYFARIREAFPQATPEDEAESTAEDGPQDASAQVQLDFSHLSKDEEEEEDEAASLPFTLSSEECRAIREEAVQYYHRYVSLFALEDYEGVFRDATHNLHLIEMCSRLADDESDRMAMEPLRLHTLMTRAKAQASAAVAAEDSKTALNAIDYGLEQIRAAAAGLELSEEEFDELEEVQLLRSMRESLVPRLPVSQRSELQERLRAALAAENYELAAILRDELRMLGN